MSLRSVVPFLLAVVLLAGCGQGESSGDGADPSPSASAEGADQQQAAEALLRRHLLAADAGDCDTVKETVLVPEQVECGDVREQEGRWSADGTDLEEVPMSVEVFDDSATVTVQWPKGPEDTWDLQLAEGEWLVLSADSGDDV
ncbi:MULTISPECIES: hypothetical protein [Aeromicrobium]|uniref:hypothetical protein n=1 Tax=Aeromicrobium TaxID=2040 RepID=UPI00257AD216|nr:MULTISPECIES: hypothetical protein [Aeromicrobium]